MESGFYGLGRAVRATNSCTCGRYAMRAANESRSVRMAVGVLVCVIVVGSSPVRGDEADDIIKEALSTARTGAEAAKLLVGAARAQNNNTAVQVTLCEKAYECGMKASAGYASAVDALDLLDQIAPDQIAARGEKRLDVHRLQYHRGDRKDKYLSGGQYLRALLAQGQRLESDDKWSEAVKLYGLASGVARALGTPTGPVITERMRDASDRAMASSRLVGLKAAVEKTPDDTRTRKRLIETYLIDLDMPAEAAKYLADGLDEALREQVSLAAKDASGLTDADLLALGQWYHSLVAKTAGRGAKTRLLTRARVNLTMYLEVHKAADATAQGATKTLKSVETELKRSADALAAKVDKLRILTLTLGRGVELKLVRIEAGKFMMGSANPDECYKRSRPQHEVTISAPFYMGATEVTQEQYAVIAGKNPSSMVGQQNPVDTVSWNDAVAFCRAASRKTRKTVHLPTEAQWEYACRAGTTTVFSFGNVAKDLDAYGWYMDNSGRKTHPVAQAKPNAFGLYDMHGNVMEWCHDWCITTYVAAASRDPIGPKLGDGRVIRGGSYAGQADYLRSSGRRWDAAVCTDGRYGFRVMVVLDSARR